jgi:hypothetical protein
MDKKVLEKLFEGVDKKFLSEEAKSKVSQMIDDLVETRVKAKTLELEEKVKTLESKESIIKEKEKIVVEEAKKLAAKLGREFIAREKVMLEEVALYKKQTEKVVEKIVLESCSDYKNQVEKIALEEAQNLQTALEEVLIEQAVEAKKLQEAELAKEVSVFRESLVNKVSEFMEAELTKNIPQDIMESAAENAALKPLVEGMINTFGKNYIQLDSTSMEVIKEAKAELNKLSEAYNVKVKESVKLSAQVRELEKKMKLESLTRGMTSSQKDKVCKILEGYNVNEIDEKFSQIRDIVIAESVRTPSRISKTELKENHKLKTAQNGVVQKQLDRISGQSLNESVDPEVAEWQKTLQKQLKNG